MEQLSMWEYISKHYIGYYQCDSVLWSDILAKYLGGEMDEDDEDNMSDIESILENCPKGIEHKRWATYQACEVDYELLQTAMECHSNEYSITNASIKPEIIPQYIWDEYQSQAKELQRIISSISKVTGLGL
jgi:hypothetical protein